MRLLRLFIALIVLMAVLFYARGHFLPETHELVLYGNVDQRMVELAFKDAERVAEVLVEEGTLVEKGQVLARLESRRLRDHIAVIEAQVEEARISLLRLENGTRPEEKEQARASVDVARADLDYAEKQFRRLSGISRDSGGKAVRKSELDEAVSRLNTARAKLVLEENRLKLAEIGPRAEDIDEARAVLHTRKTSAAQLKKQLKDFELRSPARSVVNRRLLEAGDMASPERAVFSLLLLSPKWIRAYISEKDLVRIRQGMKAQVTTDGNPTPLEGTVGFISSVAEFTPKNVETTDLRTSLVYEVRIQVKDPEDRLRLGMPASVTFKIPEQGTALR